MNKITLGDVIIITVVGLFIIAFGLISQENVRLKQERQELKAEIQELNREIGEYRINEEWFEDYFDLLEGVYEREVEIARLEAKIAYLENMYLPSNEYYSEDYLEQMLDDFDDAIEITIYYYENTDQVVDLETYVATNYPALYERLLNYSYMGV